MKFINLHLTLIYVVLLCAPVKMFSQIGINNNTPKATLDIKDSGKGIPGLLLPEVKGDDLITRKSELTNGALVYVTEKPTGSNISDLLVSEITYVPSVYQYRADIGRFQDLSRPTVFESKSIIITGPIENTSAGSINGQQVNYPASNVETPSFLYTSVKFDENEKRGINTNAVTFAPTGEIKISKPGSYRLTGSIAVETSVGGGSFYVISQFVEQDEVKLHDPTRLPATGQNGIIFSTIGFVESSTEEFPDGGVSNPMCLVTVNNATPANPYILKLNARAGGSKCGFGPVGNAATPVNCTAYIAGPPTSFGPGSYIIVEQQ